MNLVQLIREYLTTAIETHRVIQSSHAVARECHVLNLDIARIDKATRLEFVAELEAIRLAKVSP